MPAKVSVKEIVAKMESTWRNCSKCGATVFDQTDTSSLCGECSGIIAAKEYELKRWQALTADQKLDELKAKVDRLAEDARHLDHLRRIG